MQNLVAKTRMRNSMVIVYILRLDDKCKQTFSNESRQWNLREFRDEYMSLDFMGSCQHTKGNYN